MTKKRFRKLFGAFMSQYMQGEKGAGRCIYSARHATPTWDKFSSYQQAWEVILELYDPDEYSVIAQGINQIVKRHQY